MWWIHKASKWYLPSLSLGKPVSRSVHMHAWSQGVGGDLFSSWVHGDGCWILLWRSTFWRPSEKWSVGVSVDGRGVASMLFLPLPTGSSFSAFGTGWQKVQRGSLAACLTEWGAVNLGLEFAGRQQLVFDPHQLVALFKKSQCQVALSLLAI